MLCLLLSYSLSLPMFTSFSILVFVIEPVICFTLVEGLEETISTLEVTYTSIPLVWNYTDH